MKSDSTPNQMPRVVFVNRFFHPDLSATSQMLSDLAFGLTASGYQIEVITSRLLYGGETSELPAHENVRGVNVKRITTTSFGRKVLPGRLVDYLSFYLAAAWRVAIDGRRGEILVIKTDPPLLVLALQPVARLRGMRVVHWYQDVFPEIMVAAGVSIGPPRLDRMAQTILRKLRDRTVRGADAIVTIGQLMKDRIDVATRRRTSIVIENWSNTNDIVPIEPQDNLLRQEWGFTDQLVVEYSGNMGFAHPFEAILNAAETLRNDPTIVFLFIGGGVRRDWLETEVVRRELVGSVHFRPYQPREKLTESLGAGDLHLVSLDPLMEGLIVPSKFYGIGAAGRPTLFIGDRNGELAHEVNRRNCGLAFTPTEGEKLAEAIRAYASDPVRRLKDGVSARKAVELRNSIEGGVLSWRTLLEDIAKDQ